MVVSRKRFDVSLIVQKTHETSTSTGTLTKFAMFQIHFFFSLFKQPSSFTGLLILTDESQNRHKMKISTLMGRRPLGYPPLHLIWFLRERIATYIGKRNR